MAENIASARVAAEIKLGFCIPDNIAEEVLGYTKRKCELNGKLESYLPLLYENELTDYYVRLAINLRGVMSNVRCLPHDAPPSPVPVCT